MTLVGNREYGTWKNGASIYKDSKGYYIVAYSMEKDSEYKKYLKNWKPEPDSNSDLCRVNKRWTLCKTKKNKSKTKSKSKSKSKTKRNKTRKHT